MDYVHPSPPFPAPKQSIPSSEGASSACKCLQPAEGSREAGPQLYFCPTATGVEGYSSEHMGGLGRFFVLDLGTVGKSFESY